jgi:type VI secretion system secreted protein VgrG
VVVQFLEGDPDNPVVIGSVYNGVNVPKYPLPDNSTRTGVVTRSSKGGSAANANELRFEDKTGSEQIFLNAEKDMDHRVEHDHRVFVGGQDSLVVKGAQYEEVDGDRHANIKGNTIDKVGGNSDINIGGNLNEQVGSNYSLQVSSNHAEQVGQSYGLNAGQQIYLKAGMTLVVESGMELCLQASGNFITIGPSGIAISGTMVMINSGGAPVSGSPGTLQSPGAPTAPDVADDGSQGGAM